MHTIIWSLNAENDTLENFVEYVRQYCISFFDNSGVKHQCVTNAILPADLQLKGVLRKNLFLIIKEAFHNILKHAEAKHVSLQIGQRDEKIILMIEDDGKGFDVNVHKDGYGLNNLDVRTKLMKGTMTIDSQPGKGTSVLIEIPYNFNGV